MRALRRRPGGRPHRVLFSHTDAHWGGDKAQMVELAAGLDRAEFAPVVVTTAEGPLSEQCAALGLETRVLPFSTFRRKHGATDYLLRAPLRLLRLFRELDVSLVHAHCDISTLALERTARWAGVPFVQHVHDMDRLWVTVKKLPALRRADAVVAISQAVASHLAGRGVPEDRLRVIYNGVHLAPHDNAGERREVRARLGLAASDVAVAVFARLELIRKGQEHVIRALAHPALAGAPVRLFLMGEDDFAGRPHERAMRDLAADAGVADRVQFLGFRRDVPALMAAMDILAAPFQREGFGRVIVEGMAAGLPIVGFRTGALPELVTEKEGVLVDPSDAEGLASALARLVTQPVLREAMGAAARRRATIFSHARHVAAVQDLYRELLSARDAEAR